MHEEPSTSELTSPHDREFRSVLSSSCGIALAGIIAAVASLKITPERGFHFDWDWLTLLWMTLGAAFNALFWRAVWEVADRPTSRAKLRVALYMAALIAAGIFGFLYPLRFLARSKLPEISFGLVMAFIFLGGIAVGMFFLARGLKAADEVELARAKQSQES